MSVSSADLGGMGGGLPLANVLYGPGTAAAMAQQNMGLEQANSAAQTAQTQQQTTGMAAKLPGEVAQQGAQLALTGAQAQQTGQLARQTEIENNIKDYLGTDTLARGEQAKIFTAQSDAAQKQHNLMQQYYISKAQSYDAGIANKTMTEDDVKNDLDNYGQSIGLKNAGEVYNAYGHVTSPSANAGPASAAVPPSYTAGRDMLVNLNPDIIRTNIQQAGETQRVGMQTGSQETIATQRVQAEKDLKTLDIQTNPNTAIPDLIRRAIAAKAQGNDAYANRLITEAGMQYEYNGKKQEQEALYRAYYSIGLQGLGIPTVGGENKTQTVEVDDGKGGKKQVQITAPAAGGNPMANNPGNANPFGSAGLNSPTLTAPGAAGPGGPPPTQPTPVNKSMAGQPGYNPVLPPSGSNFPKNQPNDGAGARMRILQDELSKETNPDNLAALLREIALETKQNPAGAASPGFTSDQAAAQPAATQAATPNPAQQKAQLIQQLPPEVQQAVQKYEQETPGAGVGRARMGVEFAITRLKEDPNQQQQVQQLLQIRAQLLKVEQLK